MENNKKRIYYLDVLRTIACMSVVMIHTSGTYVIRDFGTLNFWIGNFLDSLSRIGVPLFVMISGSLMLDENYKYSIDKNRKHIFKMIKFFCFWSLLYSIFFQILIPRFYYHSSLQIGNIVYSLIKGHYHLWYVYMIIGIYLILPLLRLWVKEENIKYVQYFIVLALCFNFLLPQIIEIGTYYKDSFNCVNDIFNYIGLKYVGGYTTYFVLGWYLRFNDLKKRKILYTLGMVSIIAEAIMTYVLSNSLNMAIQMYSDMSINVLLQTVMVYDFIKTRVDKWNSRMLKSVNIISKYSLGIYAIHAGIVYILYEMMRYVGVDSAYVTIPIVYIFSLAGSLMISWILEKLKYFKQFVI